VCCLSVQFISSIEVCVCKALKNLSRTAIGGDFSPKKVCAPCLDIKYCSSLSIRTPSLFCRGIRFPHGYLPNSGGFYKQFIYLSASRPQGGLFVPQKCVLFWKSPPRNPLAFFALNTKCPLVCP